MSWRRWPHQRADGTGCVAFSNLTTFVHASTLNGLQLLLGCPDDGAAWALLQLVKSGRLALSVSPVDSLDALLDPAEGAQPAREGQGQWQKGQVQQGQEKQEQQHEGQAAGVQARPGQQQHGCGIEGQPGPALAPTPAPHLYLSSTVVGGGGTDVSYRDCDSVGTLLPAAPCTQAHAEANTSSVASSEGELRDQSGGGEAAGGGVADASGVAGGVAGGTAGGVAGGGGSKGAFGASRVMSAQLSRLLALDLKEEETGRAAARASGRAQGADAGSPAAPSPACGTALYSLQVWAHGWVGGAPWEAGAGRCEPRGACARLQRSSPADSLGVYAGTLGIVGALGSGSWYGRCELKPGLHAERYCLEHCRRHHLRRHVECCLSQLWSRVLGSTC